MLSIRRDGGTGRRVWAGRSEDALDGVSDDDMREEPGRSKKEIRDRWPGLMPNITTLGTRLDSVHHAGASPPNGSS